MKQNGATHNTGPVLEEDDFDESEKEESVKEKIEHLFNSARAYADTRVELFKLKALDKAGDMLSSVLSKAIVLVVFLFFVILLNIGLALWLGELLGKTYYGFFVLAGIYLLAGIIFNSMRKKWFKTPLLDKIIHSFFNK